MHTRRQGQAEQGKIKASPQKQDFPLEQLLLTLQHSLDP